MKNTKTMLCGFITLILIFAVLTGCSKKDTDYAAFFYSDGIDENGFWEGVKALDYVELIDYGAILIPSEIHHISDEDLQAAIDQFLAEHPEKIMDRAIADGDSVNIDYVGSIDGVEFAGGNSMGEGAKVTAGSAEFIGDFLTQIIGHKPGETFNVNVSFPAVYQNNPSLAGKPAVFKTTINYIYGEVVQELTDEFVKNNLDDGHDHSWKTVQEMKDGIRSDLQKYAIQNYVGEQMNTDEYMTTKVNIKSVP